jgi:hypothetical protein
MRKRDISVGGETKTEDEKEEGTEDGIEEGTKETAIVYRCLYQVCPRNKISFQASTYLQNYIRLYIGKNKPIYQCPYQSCPRNKTPFTELSKLQSHNRLKYKLYSCTRGDYSYKQQLIFTIEELRKH